MKSLYDSIWVLVSTKSFLLNIRDLVLKLSCFLDKTGSVIKHCMAIKLFRNGIIHKYENDFI